MFFSASDSRPVTKTFDGPVEKLRKGLRKNGMKDARRTRTLSRWESQGEGWTESEVVLEGRTTATVRPSPQPSPGGRGRSPDTRAAFYSLFNPSSPATL